MTAPSVLQLPDLLLDERPGGLGQLLLPHILFPPQLGHPILHAAHSVS